MTNSISNPASQYHRGLHYFALFLTAWTFFVVTLGGAVKSNEAGLSIPEAFILEWLPNWWERPNLRLEFAHRAVVGILGIGVLLMVCWTHLVETRQQVRNFSIYCLGGVLINAIFGYMTVRYFAHWQTSIPHVALGHTLLGLIACFATMQSPAWTSALPAEPDTETPPLYKLARASLIAAFVQLLLGAAIRHDDHGKALLEDRAWLFYTHLVAHVIGALALLHYAARLLLRIFREHRNKPSLMNPAHLLMMLIGVQLMLGPAAAILKVMYSHDSLDADGPPMQRAWVATSHVVIGALILAISFVLYARARRYTVPQASSLPDSSRRDACDTSAARASA